MAKVYRPQIPMDKEIGQFVSRVGAIESPLSYVRKWVFTRNTEGFNEVQITFIADDELNMFGKPEQDVPQEQRLPFEDEEKE